MTYLSPWGHHQALTTVADTLNEDPEASVENWIMVNSLFKKVWDHVIHFFFFFFLRGLSKDMISYLCF